MRMMRIAVFVFVLLLCRFQVNAQQTTTTALMIKNGPAQEERVGDSVQNTVIEKEKLAWELTKKKDKSNLANLLSEDFVEITNDGRMDKAQILTNLDNVTINTYSTGGFIAKNVAPNTVLLIYKVTVSGSYKGKPFKNNNYAASMWVERDGKWQNLFFQETVLP